MATEVRTVVEEARTAEVLIEDVGLTVVTGAAEEDAAGGSDPGRH